MSETATEAPSSTFTCPECGREFTRSAALGAHRKQAHGVAGASRRGRTAARLRNSHGNGGASTTVDHDKLLKLVFPDGAPASERTLQATLAWLEEADRLAASTR
jgi:hypothetical protein